MNAKDDMSMEGLWGCLINQLQQSSEKEYVYKFFLTCHGVQLSHDKETTVKQFFSKMDCPIVQISYCKYSIRDFQNRFRVPIMINFIPASE